MALMLSRKIRPRSSSPTVPMYLVRSPSLTHVTIALATWPPGDRISLTNGALPPYAGNRGTSRSVSVAFRPTPTTSNSLFMRASVTPTPRRRTRS